MKIKWKRLILALAIPLAVGGLSAFLTKDSMQTFESINKPPLSPPGWIFSIVWTVLFILMGIASYLVSLSPRDTEKKKALFVYGLQLVVNFFWTIIFFNLGRYLLSFIWILLLWVLIIVTILDFKKLSKASAYLLLPYFLWVTFAAYLNFGIYLLN